MRPSLSTRKEISASFSVFISVNKINVKDFFLVLFFHQLVLTAGAKASCLFFGDDTCEYLPAERLSQSFTFTISSSEISLVMLPFRGSFLDTDWLSVFGESDAGCLVGMLRTSLYADGDWYVKSCSTGIVFAAAADAARNCSY